MKFEILNGEILSFFLLYLLDFELCPQHILELS